MVIINVLYNGRKIVKSATCDPSCVCDDCMSKLLGDEDTDKCREGPNAGKPGPCPKPKPTGGSQPKPKPNKPKTEKPKKEGKSPIKDVMNVSLNPKETEKLFGKEAVEKTKPLDMENFVAEITRMGGTLPQKEEVVASTPSSTSITSKKGKAEPQPAGTMEIPDHVEFVQNLPKDQQVALNDYTSHGFANLNESMRKCPPNFACVSGKERQKMGLVEKAVQSAGRLKEPINVMRGLKGVSKAKLKSLLDSVNKAQKNGTEFNMPSITSTSLKEDPDFINSGTNVQFKIVAKSGLFVASLSDYPQEQEFLQSAFTRYKVKKVTEGKVNIIELEEI